MKTSSTSEAEVRMNDGGVLVIRLHNQGYFPRKLNGELEEMIAEGLHTYLRDSNFQAGKLRDNPTLLTELLEMELDEKSAEWPETIRYTKVGYKSTPKTMTWEMTIFLEGACAPCRTTIELTPRGAND